MHDGLPHFLRRAWRWARQHRALQAAATRMGVDFAPIDIAEILPIEGRPSEIDRPRLNLLLPTIRPTHVFGGISTALHFFDVLKAQDIDVRVILTDHAYQQEALPATLNGWQIRSAAEDDAAGRLVVSHAFRYRNTLPVRSRDLFVATAWWTAYTAQRLVRWQAMQFGRDALPMVYLVQDHEPGFYPQSSRYLMARSTYEYDGPMIGVFNTTLLRDYFRQQGYSFTQSHAFEPELNPVLAQARRQASYFQKERLLVLYGRPSVPRNAFELLCQGVKEWSLRDPEAARWRIESIGELHQDIELHHGARIVSRGKLTLQEYADTLSRAAVGVSLMLSPHPSYPPLEMAEFGVRVVTNSHENKDLGLLSDFICSLQSVTPEKIAEQLQMLTAPWRERDLVSIESPSHSLFAASGTAFPFASSIRSALQLDAMTA